VLFARTTHIVQKLQAARQALQLEAAIAKLDKYQLLILDDLSYSTSPRQRQRRAGFAVTTAEQNFKSP
jgi:DNA replication protein DnaC